MYVHCDNSSIHYTETALGAVNNMWYIFMDESGCLWFNTLSSKFFTLSFLFVKEKKPLTKIVKKIHQWLSKKWVKVSGGVLHATKEKPVTRQRLLRKLWSIDGYVMSIYLNKSKVYTRLQNEKHILYNYVTNILIDRILIKKLLPQWIPITLIASRRETNKILNQQFERYLSNKLIDHPYGISVSIKTPAQEKWLQVVDFVSRATFQKYEFQDESYRLLFDKIVVEEQWLFS